MKDKRQNANTQILNIEEFKELDLFQAEAVKVAFENDISIITGYAGTGKSFVIKRLSEFMEEKDFLVSRVAPTGRASQVIFGSTIHRWLEPIIREVRPYKYEIIGFNKKHFQNNECLIVDESSMIDNEIWNEIIRVWKNSKNIKNKKIIFVGDPGQLEPIGEGQPFIELIQRGLVKNTELKTIHRTKNNEAILELAYKVRETGKIEYVNSKNIFKISMEEAYDIVLNDKSAQMITPYRNNESGSLAINKEIKELTNNTSSIFFYTRRWSDKIQNFENHTKVHQGDRIIIVRNMWEWNITNGTIGEFVGIEKVKLYNYVKKTYGQKRQSFKFFNPQTKEFFYLPKNKKVTASIELSYAITIHKSQGSEFDKTIIYIPSNSWFLNKKMLYTAITRTKNKLYLVF